MPRFLLTWDAGYGPSTEEVEADNQEDANQMAYEAWREEAESNAKYTATPLDKDEP